MILYREKTRIRFCIYITDTGKREKILHFEIRYRDMPFCSVLFLYEKNIQTKERSAA